jgi:hypothetical protein
MYHSPHAQGWFVHLRKQLGACSQAESPCSLEGSRNFGPKQQHECSYLLDVSYKSTLLFGQLLLCLDRHRPMQSPVLMEICSCSSWNSQMDQAVRPGGRGAAGGMAVQHSKRAMNRALKVPHKAFRALRLPKRAAAVGLPLRHHPPLYRASRRPTLGCKAVSLCVQRLCHRYLLHAAESFWFPLRSICEDKSIACTRSQPLC